MYIGIDIGGTKTAIGVSIDDKKIKILQKEVLLNSNNFEEDYLNIKQCIQRICEGSKLRAIGIALPGILNSEKDEIIKFSHLHNWENKPIKKRLAEDFSTTVSVMNDVSAAALGEYIYSNSKKEDQLFVIWGTGIASALIKNINEKLFIENNECGFQLIDSEIWGRQCSGKAIESKYGNVNNLSESQWDDITNCFSRGVYNLTLITGSKSLIIGGGIIEKSPFLLEKIQLFVKQLFQNNSIPQLTPRITTSVLKSDAPIYGAITGIGLNP